MSNQTILGIDPGLACTGYGVIQNSNPTSLIDIGVIRTKASDKIAFRVKEIYEGIIEIIELYKPQIVGIETIFLGKNFQSSLKLGYARGVILLATAINSIETIELSPREVKKAVCGNGNASKNQVSYMVENLLNKNILVKCPKDATDALAVAIACRQILKFKNLLRKK